MIAFFLNLPYTFVGILVAILLVPKKCAWNKIPTALVFHVRSTWLLDVAYKGWRGVVMGHVVILNQRVEENDLAHELIHVEQNIRRPVIQPFLYQIETIKKGYRNNKYEVEAYSKSGSAYHDSSVG